MDSWIIIDQTAALLLKRRASCWSHFGFQPSILLLCYAIRHHLQHEAPDHKSLKVLIATAEQRRRRWKTLPGFEGSGQATKALQSVSGAWRRLVSTARAPFFAITRVGEEKMFSAGDFKGKVENPAGLVKDSEYICRRRLRGDERGLVW